MKKVLIVLLVVLFIITLSAGIYFLINLDKETKQDDTFLSTEATKSVESSIIEEKLTEIETSTEPVEKETITDTLEMEDVFLKKGTNDIEEAHYVDGSKGNGIGIQGFFFRFTHDDTPYIYFVYQPDENTIEKIAGTFILKSDYEKDGVVWDKYTINDIYSNDYTEILVFNNMGDGILRYKDFEGKFLNKSNDYVLNGIEDYIHPVDVNNEETQE